MCIVNIKIVGQDCCGCRTCEQVCPKSCIKMVENKDGFIYPQVEESLCINCSICIKKCPVHNYNESTTTPKIYAFRNKDNSRLMNSASGGACDVVSRKIISDGGVVYGVAFDESFNAKYIRIDNEENLTRIQSSKYVFADTGDTYSQVKEDLTNGIKVLYTGVSCQIDGLLNFLGKDYSNLFTISLICHGVPSPALFRDYIKYRENELGEKIVAYNFRYKYKNQCGLYERIISDNGKASITPLSMTTYGKDFLSGVNYRENCYHCHYCNIHRVGDWSVGDFWGIEKCHPDFADKRGTSVVLVMNQKGEDMLRSIFDNAYLLESNITNALLDQDNLKKPTDRPSLRNQYYTIWMNDANFFQKRKPPKNIKYYLKKMCPNFVKSFIKRHR